MISPENFGEVKRATKEFFQKADFMVDISFMQKEDTVSIDLKSDDPKMLIGQSGQTLAEIQKLLRAVLKRKVSEEFYCDVDVNDYKKKKKEYLIETAQDAANEVFLSGKEKVLPPMPSYERRVIHVELSNRSDVKVESMGEEPDRRVVIKPALS